MFLRSCLPRSLMFMTPLALELARRCLWMWLSFGGDVASRPWTAESTLVSGSPDMVVMVWLDLATDD